MLDQRELGVPEVGCAVVAADCACWHKRCPDGREGESEFAARLTIGGKCSHGRRLLRQKRLDEKLKWRLARNFPRGNSGRKRLSEAVIPGRIHCGITGPRMPVPLAG